MRCAAFVIAVGAALALEQLPAPESRPLELPSPVRDKNFYLLSVLERDPAAHDAVRKDAVLGEMAFARLAELDRVVKNCGTDTECNAAAFRWSDAQIEQGSRALASLYRASPAVRTIADGPLRVSGMYVRYQDFAGEEMLERAWTDCLRGINRAIEVYALGKAPRYPAIDSITYDPKTDAYRRVLRHAVAVLQDDRSSLDLAWSTSLRFALEAMFLNHRDEAGRFEPMETGENAAAFRRVKSIAESSPSTGAGIRIPRSSCRAPAATGLASASRPPVSCATKLPLSATATARRRL